MLEKLELKNVTAFSNLSLKLKSGLNVIVGENGAGKTHIG